MKVNKKAMSLCAVLVGAAVFATAAAADVVLGSGYSGAKEVLKASTAYFADEAENFTVHGEFLFEVDGRTFMQSTLSAKFDNQNVVKEIDESYIEPDGVPSQRYYYQDKDRYVSYDEENDLYRVYLQNVTMDEKLFSDPFKEDEMQDLERIADALAGTMKDVIQVEEADGGRIYTGTMCDAQVPALVNAVGSFLMKRNVFNDSIWEEYKFPAVQSDIFLQEASGKMLTNEEGILENAMGMLIFNGKSQDGVNHTVRVEVSIALTDVNETAITLPELTDENSVIETSSQPSLDERYVGTYKNDIVICQQNGFIKIGERVLTIISDQNGMISGTYAESYRPGYEKDALSFDFVANPTSRHYGDAEIVYTVDGESRIGLLHITGDSQQNLRFTPNVVYRGEDDGYSSKRQEGFDGEFVRCLD